ncbi:MAG: S-layer homology domain-containing protein [Firmicutes bacterium]|nr:S-layer homology domain-containing protein [Bacillota bacterium]
MKLRFRSGIMFAIVLILSISNINFANYNSQYLEEANKLKELKVFQGSGEGFELDRPPTRLEGAIMFIRLLGVEKVALKEDNSHPFKDVPDWGSPYVGYLYKMGLTQGVSDTEFGSDKKMLAKSYTTFLLRALGYEDAEGDFSWGTALEYSKDIDLLDESLFNSLNDNVFLRDHVAKLSINTLSTDLKNKSGTLSDKLISQDVFTSEKALSLGLKTKDKRSQKADLVNASIPNYSNIKGITNYVVLKGLTYYRPMIAGELPDASYDKAFAYPLYDFEVDRLKKLNPSINWDGYDDLKWTQFDWNNNSHGKDLTPSDYWYENDGGNPSTVLSYVKSQNLRLPTEKELHAFLNSFNIGIIEDYGWPEGRYWTSDLAAKDPDIHRYIDSRDLIADSNNDAYNNYVILVSDIPPKAAKETIPDEILKKGIFPSTKKLYGMNDIPGVANSIMIDGTLIYRPYTTNEIEALIGEKMYDYSISGEYGYALSKVNDFDITIKERLNTLKKSNPNVNWDVWVKLEWPLFDRMHENNDWGLEEKFKGNPDAHERSALNEVEELKDYDVTPAYLLERLAEAYPDGQIESTFGWPINYNYFTSTSDEVGFYYSYDLMNPSFTRMQNYKYLNYVSLIKSDDIKRFRLKKPIFKD